MAQCPYIECNILTVRANTKSQDPRNPPPIVFHSLLAISALNICMPPNMTTHRESEITSDTELDMATKYKHNCWIYKYIHALKEC